jgi:hypothetical protein
MPSTRANAVIRCGLERLLLMMCSTWAPRIVSTSAMSER